MGAVYSLCAALSSKKICKLSEKNFVSRPQSPYPADIHKNVCTTGTNRIKCGLISRAPDSKHKYPPCHRPYFCRILRSFAALPFPTCSIPAPGGVPLAGQPPFTGRQKDSRDFWPWPFCHVSNNPRAPFPFGVEESRIVSFSVTAFRITGRPHTTSTTCSAIWASAQWSAPICRI